LKTAQVRVARAQQVVRVAGPAPHVLVHAREDAERFLVRRLRALQARHGLAEFAHGALERGKRARCRLPAGDLLHRAARLRAQVEQPRCVGSARRAQRLEQLARLRERAGAPQGLSEHLLDLDAVREPRKRRAREVAGQERLACLQQFLRRCFPFGLRTGKPLVERRVAGPDLIAQCGHK
jgi:hypothetical protein